MLSTLAGGGGERFFDPARSADGSRQVLRDAAGHARKRAVVGAAVGGRRRADELREARAERAERRAADREADLGDRQVAAAQQKLRPLDPAGHQVGVGRLAVGLLEPPREVGGRHERPAGERRHVERPRVLTVDQVARTAQVREVLQLVPCHSASVGAFRTLAAMETAILAGGCFWGMQDLIRRRPGVVSTRVGYTGGDVPNATYRNHGPHAEAIEIVFDPAQTSYRELLEFFFQIHDPTTPNRQGNDVGTSYRSAIFYLDDEQRRVAEDTIADVDASGLWPGKVVTEVAPAGPFWEAEPEHQ